MRSPKYMKYGKFTPTPKAKKLKKQTRDLERKAEARQRLAAVTVAAMVQGAIDTAVEHLELRARAKTQAGKVHRWSEEALDKILGPQRYTDQGKRLTREVHKKSSAVDAALKAAYPRQGDDVTWYMGYQAIMWIALSWLCDEALQRGLADKLGCRQQWRYLATTVSTWAYMAMYHAPDIGDDHEGIAGSVSMHIDQIIFAGVS